MVVFRGLFHLGCGIFYIYGTYYDMQIVTENILIYGGRSKYLTFLNLVSYYMQYGTSLIPVASCRVTSAVVKSNYIVQCYICLLMLTV